MGRFGTFIFLGLPIGNPNDISLRVLEALKEAQYLFCEDTRKLKQLLKFLNIDYSKKKILSFHDHSTEKRLHLIKELIDSGNDVFYASDAGSPIVSDPGYELSRFCLKHGIKIDSFSGVSSVINSLELSGLPPIPFSFHGFLGRDDKDIADAVDKVQMHYGTHIFFESKHRLEQSLNVMCNSLKDYDFVILKELTKEYQNVYRFKGDELENFITQIDQRGEFVLMIHNHHKNQASSSKLKSLAQKCLSSKGKKKVLSQLISEILEVNQNDIFKELSE